MLNTDAHSPKIPQHRKMTKAQFISNNREALAAVDASFLEEMYERVVRHPFATDMAESEVVYRRILAFSRETVKDSKGSLSLEDLEERLMATPASVFVKYPFRASARIKRRKVYLSNNAERVCWSSLRSKRSPRYLLTDAITDFSVGRATTNVLKRHEIAAEVDSLVFSIHTGRRTLDL
jgi:hypothetical protein